MKTLFVTSASIGTQHTDDAGSAGGLLFCLEAGVIGAPVATYDESGRPWEVRE